MVVECPYKNLSMIIMLLILENGSFSISEILHFVTRWQQWFENERHLTKCLTVVNVSMDKCTVRFKQAIVDPL